MILMRVREKKYEDYGLFEEELAAVKDYCSSPTLEQQHIIMDACVMTNPYIAQELFNSLVHKKSYQTQAFKKYIPFSEKDFYAYRRATMALLYKFIMLGLIY